MEDDGAALAPKPPKPPGVPNGLAAGLSGTRGGDVVTLDAPNLKGAPLPGAGNAPNGDAAAGVEGAVVEAGAPAEPVPNNDVGVALAPPKLKLGVEAKAGFVSVGAAAGAAALLDSGGGLVKPPADLLPS